MQTERLESMSPDGYLRLIKQDDGDVIVTVGQPVDRGGKRSWETSSVEFCTPGSGGGGSSRTWKALLNLMGAMAADNLDTSQQARRPPGGIDDDEQRTIAEVFPKAF